MPSGCWTPCLLRKKRGTELASLRRTLLHFAGFSFYANRSLLQLEMELIFRASVIPWMEHDGCQFFLFLSNSLKGKFSLLSGLCLIQLLENVLHLSLFLVPSALLKITFLKGLIKWVMYVIFCHTRFSILQKESTSRQECLQDSGVKSIAHWVRKQIIDRCLLLHNANFQLM